MSSPIPCENCEYVAQTVLLLADNTHTSLCMTCSEQLNDEDVIEEWFI